MITNIRICIVGIITLGLLSGCTKKDPNRVEFPSPIKFTYDASLAKGENIARVDGENITLSQLLSPSPALMELEQRMQMIILDMAYAKAVEKAAGGEATLTLGFADPKTDLKKHLGAKFNKNIEVKFDEAMGPDTYMINDESFPTANFEADNRLLAQLRSDSFTQKMQALEGIVARRKILQAAKAKDMHMEVYIQKEVLKNDIAVSDQEVTDYGKKNNISEPEMTEEMRARLKDILKGRHREQMIIDYAAANFIKSPVQIGFKRPAVKMTLPAVGEAAPHKGSGPIEVTLFSYVQCEECKDVTKTLSEFVDDNSKYFKLNYIFNFPGNNNEERMVAEAAMCLKKQNEDFFWKFPENLKKDGATPLEDNINNAAKAVGAKFDDFRTCFLAREFREAVEAHVQGTQTLGFFRSPVVVLDGTVYESPSAEGIVEKARDLKAQKGLGFNLFYNIKKALFGS
jgi:protein-disulfide isomerase